MAIPAMIISNEVGRVESKLKNASLKARVQSAKVNLKMTELNTTP